MSLKRTLEELWYGRDYEGSRFGGLEELSTFISNKFEFQPNIFQGECNCGGIEIIMKGHPCETFLCFCDTCQQRTGSYSASEAAYKIQQIDIMIKRPGVTLKTYVNVVDRQYHRIQQTTTKHFCDHCGTTLYWQSNKTPELYFIPLGIIQKLHYFPPPSVIIGKDDSIVDLWKRQEEQDVTLIEKEIRLKPNH